MKILSLCDGMACGLIAFGPDVEYHAIEINKNSRLLADSNFPGKIIRWANDVTEVTKKQIEKHGPFDWIIMGPTCKSVSIASNGDGLLGSSGILIDCLRVKKWCEKQNPKIKYMIENVKMKNAFYDQFCSLIGHKAELINSALVSAQNRKRYYWTNFKVNQPLDKQIILGSILEDGWVADREKALCMTASYRKGTNLLDYLNKKRKQIAFGWSKSTRYQDVLTKKVYSTPGKNRNSYIEDRLNLSGKSNTLTCGEGCKNRSSATYVASEKNNDLVYRMLTVNECARLQTIPHWFNFSAVSKNHAYRSIGDGWTVDVVKHIISEGMK